MTDREWVPITGTDADPQIGDAEIISIHFRPDGGGLLLDLQNLVAAGALATQMRFRGVRFFQLCNEGVHYLDHAEVFDSVSEALGHLEIGPYLRAAFSDSPVWLSFLSAAGLKVYRLVPIAGAETFIVCQQAEMRPWRPKPE